MRINWITQKHDLKGNALGYNTHNSAMMDHSRKYFEFSDDAEIAIQICPADLFRPIPGKINVLFTMFECNEVPVKYVWALNNADLIVVPCRFCRDLFARYTRRPIEVCFEGVDVDTYRFHERIMPLVGQPFRLLWIGAPNPRKGYISVVKISKVVEQTPDLELYMKTTVPEFNRREYIESLWKNRQKIRKAVRRMELPEDQSVASMLKRSRLMQKNHPAGKLQTRGIHKNVILDARMVSRDELVKMYQHAHAFIFPTLGEGWGLTLCEAMATGLPCIANNVTGCRDFFDESVGYEIHNDPMSQYFSNYEFRCNIPVPDTNDIMARIVEVYHNYPAALRKGKRAAERIRSKFTWDQSARRLREIIQKHFQKEVATCQK